MPFTLSHPVAVIAAPKSKYLHKSALIIGSMSPDFINYLIIRYPSKLGHTLAGSFILDLPLCFLFFYLYCSFISPYIWKYLPNCLNIGIKEKPLQRPKDILIFAPSALIGIFSHIALDSLLHKSSDLLRYLGFISAYPTGYLLYQVSISFIGLLIICLYSLKHAKGRATDNTVTFSEKLKYWCIVSLFSLCFSLMLTVLNVIAFSVYTLVTCIVAIIFFGILSTGIVYRIIAE